MEVIILLWDYVNINWDIPGICKSFKKAHCQLTIPLRNGVSAGTNVL